MAHTGAQLSGSGAQLSGSGAQLSGPGAQLSAISAYLHTSYLGAQLSASPLNRQLERTLNGSCLQQKFRDRLELEIIICVNFIILNKFVNIFLY